MAVRELISDHVLSTNLNTSLGVRMGAKIKKNTKNREYEGAPPWRVPSCSPIAPVFAKGAKTRNVSILIPCGFKLSKRTSFGLCHTFAPVPSLGSGMGVTPKNISKVRPWTWGLARGFWYAGDLMM